MTFAPATGVNPHLTPALSSQGGEGEAADPLLPGGEGGERQRAG